MPGELAGMASMWRIDGAFSDMRIEKKGKSFHEILWCGNDCCTTFEHCSCFKEKLFPLRPEHGRTQKRKEDRAGHHRDRGSYHSSNAFRCEIFSKMSNSKFNVNIKGGSGSIVMGDHTSVNITSRQSNSGKIT